MVNEYIEYINTNYLNYKNKNLQGRYLTIQNIESIIKKLPDNFQVSHLGNSFNDQSIYKIKVGTGKIKLLFWSQMHGNETTGTKALFDLFNFIINPLALETLRDKILKETTLTFIPMLNPDGAKAYTRVNAQNIDLNRDAVNFVAPESKLLHKVLNDIKPNYCFNLHDQRTIFSVTEANNPATLSFLAPSVDIERTVTVGRKETMKLIVGISNDLQELIPNQIGRYTDEFYPTATGDNFQKKGFNTILIEAGHYQNDYQREIVRKFNFIALISGINHTFSAKDTDYTSYFKIPNNEKKYTDLIYANLIIKSEKKIVEIYFNETLNNNKIEFIPEFKELETIDNLNANIIDYQEYKFDSIVLFKEFVKRKIIL